jgi:hypothetical protein
MPFEKLPPIQGGYGPCNCCGMIHDSLPMSNRICVGFGSATVCKGDECVFDAGNLDYFDCWTVQDAEDAAKADPDHDWRIHLYGPLKELHYQRHGDGHWVLYERGEGFA